MPRSFGPELQQLVERELATGQYASEDELLLEAVHLLADRNRRREATRRELRIGRDQLDRGEGIELEDDEALEKFLEEIETEVHAELAAEKKSE